MNIFIIILYTITAGTPPPAYQPHDDNSHNPHSQQTVNLQHGTRRPPPTPMDTMPSGGIYCCKLINKSFYALRSELTKKNEKSEYATLVLVHTK